MFYLRKTKIKVKYSMQILYIFVTFSSCTSKFNCLIYPVSFWYRPRKKHRTGPDTGSTYVRMCVRVTGKMRTGNTYKKLRMDGYIALVPGLGTYILWSSLLQTTLQPWSVTSLSVKRHSTLNQNHKVKISQIRINWVSALGFSVRGRVSFMELPTMVGTYSHSAYTYFADIPLTKTRFNSRSYEVCNK